MQQATRKAGVNMGATYTVSDRADALEKMEVICLAAQTVLENGGETYRVEETAKRMAEGLGLKELSITAFPTSIFMEAQGRARLRRIRRRGTNLLRLTEVNDISRRVERGEMTAACAREKLEAINEEKGPSQLTMVITSGLAGASFSLLFGGNLGTFVVAFVIGMLGQLVQPLFSHIEMSAFFGNFAGGLIAAVLAEGVSLFVPYGSVNATIIGSIMPWLSGLSMTNAVRDTMYGDLVSGVTRAVEGMLMAAFTALGVYVGLWFFAAKGGILG